MSVVFLASRPYGGLPHRLGRLAEGCAALGAGATYLEPAPSPTSGGRTATVREEAGLRIVRVPFPVVPAGFALRMPREDVRRIAFQALLREQAPDAQAAVADSPYWGEVVCRGDFPCLLYDPAGEGPRGLRRGRAQRSAGAEEKLLACATGAMVCSDQEAERLQSPAPGLPLHRLPGGVDAEWFQAQASRLSVPGDIRAIPRPIIGFAGRIGDGVDAERVRYAARRVPAASFVFIGPAGRPRIVRTLERSPNVFWLGEKEYRDVPAYVGAFDVGWFPVRDARVRRMPLSLYECFALGKPVVAPPFPGTETLRERGLIHGDTDEAAALGTALQDGSDRRRADRMGYAREHSWKRVAARLLAILSEPATLPEGGASAHPDRGGKEGGNAECALSSA